MRLFSSPSTNPPQIVPCRDRQTNIHKVSPSYQETSQTELPHHDCTSESATVQASSNNRRQILRRLHSLAGLGKHLDQTLEFRPSFGIILGLRVRLLCGLSWREQLLPRDQRSLLLPAPTIMIVKEGPMASGTLCGSRIC